MSSSWPAPSAFRVLRSTQSSVAQLWIVQKCRRNLVCERHAVCVRQGSRRDRSVALTKSNSLACKHNAILWKLLFFYKPAAVFKAEVSAKDITTGVLLESWHEPHCI